jgi:branched-chain amino acid transport system permease protein
LLENVLLLVLDGLALGCIYALIALGYTMVYGIIKLINFAHGEFYMVGAYAAFGFLLAAKSTGLPEPANTALLLFLAILAAALAAGILAVIVEKLAYRPLRRASRIAALLTALGVSLLLQNVALKLFTADTRPFHTGVVDARYPRITVPKSSIRPGAVFDRDLYWRYRGSVDNFLVPANTPVTPDDMDAVITHDTSPAVVYYYPLITVRKKQIIIWIAALVLTVGLQLLVKFTNIGKAMRAVSYDFETAELMGINVDRVITFTFFIGAVLAGAGAVLVGMYYGTIKPTMGVMYGLKAFVAAVLGGIGSIPGALLGGLALGTAESLVKVSPATAPFQDAFAFAVLVLILVFLPNGFFGREERERV